MNRGFLLYLLVFQNLCFSFAQKHDNPFKFAPPGSVFLFDSLYIDETEMSNLAYIEYLYWISEDSTEDFYLSQLPISIYTRYNFKPKDSLDSVNHQYLFDRGRRYYPVLGVSYDQAVNYCSWRSNFVNQKLNEKEYRARLRISKKYNIKFDYRLPTKEEWEFAAAGGLNPNSFPYGMVRPRLDDDKFSFKIKDDPEYWVSGCLDTLNINYNQDEFIHKVEFNVKEDFYFGLNELISCDIFKYSGLVHTNEYPTNSYGLYNMIGNVAEMTLTKGIAKGGAFIHSIKEFNLMTDFSYEEPANWLGFRCVCEVEINDRR